MANKPRTVQQVLEQIRKLQKEPMPNAVRIAKLQAWVAKQGSQVFTDGNSQTSTGEPAKTTGGNHRDCRGVHA